MAQISVAQQASGQRSEVTLSSGKHAYSVCVMLSKPHLAAWSWGSPLSLPEERAGQSGRADNSHSKEILPVDRYCSVLFCTLGKGRGGRLRKCLQTFLFDYLLKGF